MARRFIVFCKGGGWFLQVLNFRHNIMHINSYNDFLSIRGGCNNNTRDVYFVRGLGEPEDINGLIVEADRKMDMEADGHGTLYRRFNELPQLREMSDSDYYSGIYLNWKDGGGTCSFRHIKTGETLANVISSALNIILDKYKNAKQAVTPSMERNLAVKLLYWLDQCTGELLAAWNEKSCIKIVADNVLKEQEYLYYLFLTFLGCDVFLYESRCDINAADGLLAYSQELVLGKFGTSSIVPYVKTIPEEAVKPGETVKAGNVLKAEKILKAEKTVKAECTKKAGNTIKAEKIIKAGNAVKAENTKKAGNMVKAEKIIKAGNVESNRPVAEKSFEELALLASSVVLIAVHDLTGDILGTGSGIMIGQNGFILTNNHVAAGGRYYSVRVEEEEETYVTDEVIKYNPNTDLAVIRIKRKLNPIPIFDGRKKLVRGQKVVAIGSPLGLFNSVSNGIISGFRNIQNVDMIQFTAPISHGSSGGALLNMQGEVIGISTAGIDSGQNINLAIGYENIKMFTKGFTG